PSSLMLRSPLRPVLPGWQLPRGSSTRNHGEGQTWASGPAGRPFRGRQGLRTPHRQPRKRRTPSPIRRRDTRGSLVLHGEEAVGVGQVPRALAAGAGQRARALVVAGADLALHAVRHDAARALAEAAPHRLQPPPLPLVVQYLALGG